ncbi:MAG: 2-hydroxyacyl-CoA dehydratase family protein, partial [Desulfobacterales bacterium]|nr:2-hydroxyacyl-CoA dehydratase family protein [Desulfobacterales bacterium]
MRIDRETIQKENTEARRKQIVNFLTVTGLGEIAPKDAVAFAFPKAFDDLSPSAKRGWLNTKQFFNAYNLDIDGSEKYHHVAWRSLFVPTEIMYAMDLLPYTTEMVASQLAMAGAASERIETAEAHNFSGDICSFMKAVAGGVIEDIFPSPDILLTSTHLCDPSAKYAELAARTYKRPEFILDIPYGVFDLALSGSDEDLARVEEAVDYVADQLREMVAFITRHTGLTLDDEKMRKVIRDVNKAKEWLDGGNDICFYQRTSAKKGIRELDYAANLMQTWGTPEIVDVYKSRFEEYKKGITDASADDRSRITWFHLRPYFKTPLMDYLNERIDISGSQANYAFWQPLDE